jgi:acetoin utilization deacetylase AcuC-like enzyme
MVEEALSDKFDIIGVSAGFDSHKEDWGGVLSTEHYREIGKMVKKASKKHEAGCFAVMEGGYNHEVLGQNVMAFIHGMKEQ